MKNSTRRQLLKDSAKALGGLIIISGAARALAQNAPVQAAPAPAPAPVTNNVPTTAPSAAFGSGGTLNAAQSGTAPNPQMPGAPTQPTGFNQPNYFQGGYSTNNSGFTQPNYFQGAYNGTSNNSGFNNSGYNNAGYNNAAYNNTNSNSGSFSSGGTAPATGVQQNPNNSSNPGFFQPGYY